MLIVVGAILSLVLGGLAGVLWGGAAGFAAGCFGLIATAIQWVADRLLIGRREAQLQEFVKRWATGMALRVGGVVLLVVAVLVDRTLFPPLAAAMGYVGVLIPLLFLELKRLT
jgi:hypothetical protein